MSVIESDTTAVVWKVLVKEGDKVDDGALESMKMEIPIEAEESGTVVTVHVAEGAAVSDGDTLVTLG
ncbi:acetyl-CoA carboxylase biotin carboxyl carrier protein subunit [Actinomadura vinacea]|uniref:Acetyl-CoA carboxylase biotin carboxyl carrier protein subunit n=1 Tax=Actinomadura vinacea TaxID=115336 RepID=A0ABP5WLN1_9ACTN